MIIQPRIFSSTPGHDFAEGVGLWEAANGRLRNPWPISGRVAQRFLGTFSRLDVWNRWWLVFLSKRNQTKQKISYQKGDWVWIYIYIQYKVQLWNGNINDQKWSKMPCQYHHMFGRRHTVDGPARSCTTLDGWNPIGGYTTYQLVQDFATLFRSTKNNSLNTQHTEVYSVGNRCQRHERLSGFFQVQISASTLRCHQTWPTGTSSIYSWFPSGKKTSIYVGFSSLLWLDIG